IFGTVLLTILLTIVVVPLGVIAAVYIREYARQGLLISVIRVAINNLAGVPSIVYGVFGLGFFCYTLGRYIDVGPQSPLAPADGLLSFWPLFTLLTLIAIAGASVGLLTSPPPGAPRRPRAASLASSCVWLLCAALALYLIARTPYFGGLFAVKAPSPTFGTRGILWGALTLALLTLPVVIVATEEAIAAVPRSMREGSHACGATTWQTIRGIVLPGAMPGILTGAILAMARGAGEVAPLMLVGAAKQAPNLPLTTEFPFIHADRSFMHLGFHIYDLGLQSPDSQAARPLVWTTTLLLLIVVLAMNLAAILLRARLRARAVSSAT
ncbi:MAG: ABC transporter permease subunit, partial [Verrucomicrobia subdivision 3 bacterium]|nr:ABC transporter permease subunit [Limisphaerales bacterium]